MKIKQGQEQSTDMLQIPKAGGQTPEQDPEERGSIYFSLENQINLVQASQIPDKNHWNPLKGVLCQASITNEVHIDKSNSTSETNIFINEYHAYSQTRVVHEFITETYSTYK